MGLLNFFARRKALTASPEFIEALASGFNQYPRLGGTNVNQQINAVYLQALSANYAFMYENQPAVRKAVDYIATNMAQLGCHLYERLEDDERQRDDDHPAAKTLAHPNNLGPADAFIESFVSEYLIHGNAYALKLRANPGAPIVLLIVPAASVAVYSNGRFTIDAYRIYADNGASFDVPPEDVVHWRNFNPSDPRIGLSPLDTLRAILAESSASQQAMVELSKSGLVKPGYIKRGENAPQLSQDALKRLEESIANSMKQVGRRWPVFEEGMEFADFGVSPKDAEMLASRKLNEDLVAEQYGLNHVPPEDEDERKAFYIDVLAPLSKRLACQFNFSLLEAEYQATDYYVEFNMDDKLRGDIEDRLPNLVSAAGVPVILRNEARAILNLPKVDGGDEPITPMNVIVGDNPKPAPNVMGPQDPNGPPQDGSYRELPPPKSGSEELRGVEEANRVALKQLVVSTQPRRFADLARQQRHIDKAKGVFERYYRHQASAMKSAKALDAYTERWNKALAGELHKLIGEIVEHEGGIYAAYLGAADFDMRQVENWLEAAAEGIAEGINAATQRDIEAMGVTDALARARSERTPVAATSIGTRATVFARQEAAKQSPFPQSRQQTWVANSERHADLDGVSVPLDSDWGGIEPGSEPNCSCSVSIT